MKKSILSLMLAFALVLVGCQSTQTSTTETTEATGVQADAVEQRKVFVSPQWLKSVIDGNQEESKDYVILEASWGPIESAAEYNENHIPGAFHINTDEVESEEYWNFRPAEEVRDALLKYGVTKDTTLIVYGSDSAPARVALGALWLGVENVKVLDGGIKGWKAAGYEVETTVPTPNAKTDFGTSVPQHPEYIMSIDEVKSSLADNKNFRLVSIRSLDEFEGKTSGYSYIEKMGEPKGAVWGQDETAYYNEDGTFIGIEKAKTIWAEQGITQENEIAFYCGTGWRAAIPWLIAYENGWDNVKLYDGGWYQWQMDSTNPVQSITPQEAVENLNK